MLGARTTVTPFHHQPEAQHPKIFQLSTSRRPITPSLGQKQTHAPQQTTLRIVSPFNMDLRGLLRVAPNLEAHLNQPAMLS